VVVSNPHLSLVYELYYKAFERFRVIPEICSLDDNDRFCDVLREMLREHLVVIPNLAMGVLECRDLMPANEMDKFMNTLLRAVCCLSPVSDIQIVDLTFDYRESLDVSLQSNISPSPRPSTRHGTSQTLMNART
jgi:hypothetical protein